MKGKYIRKGYMKPKNNLFTLLFFSILLITVLGIIHLAPITTEAQYWASLKPYNTLWPLWSPALSPADPITGKPVPIVTNLTSTPVLPVQPGLTWDPAWPNPWLLYNTPQGLLFYDPLYGINKWPPNYLIDPTSGAPIPIALPAGFPILAPTDVSWLQNTLSTANTTYQLSFTQFAPTPATSINLPSSLVAVLGVTTLSLPAIPPSTSELLTLIDILGYTPTPLI